MEFPQLYSNLDQQIPYTQVHSLLLEEREEILNKRSLQSPTVILLYYRSGSNIYTPKPWELWKWKFDTPRCVRWHMSYVMCHMSHVRCHVSHVRFQMSPLTPSQTGGARELKFWVNAYQTSYVTCHVPCVTYHVSRVMCHMSCVRCYYFFLNQTRWESR